MKPYELVILLQANLSSDEKQEILDSVVDIVAKDNIKQTDDMGVMKSAYSLMGKKANSHMHIVSYHLHAEPVAINEYTRQFSFLKGLLRHFFYAMKPNEKYMTYADTQKALEKLLPKQD